MTILGRCPGATIGTGTQVYGRPRMPFRQDEAEELRLEVERLRRRVAADAAVIMELQETVDRLRAGEYEDYNVG